MTVAKRLDTTEIYQRLHLDDPEIMDAVRQFCEERYLVYMALFGSVLREDYRPDGDDPSDVDVLVAFPQDHIPGLKYYGWSDALSRITGWRAEVFTKEELSRYFRDRVVDEALTIYERI